MLRAPANTKIPRFARDDSLMDDGCPLDDSPVVDDSLVDDNPFYFTVMVSNCAPETT